MKKQTVMLSPLVLGLALLIGAKAAPAQSKVGIIHIQNALVSTKDGQKASEELQQRYEPRRKEIEGKQKEVAALQDQLKRGSNTMSEEAKQSLMREIDMKTRSLNRAAEDAQADFEQDRNRVLQELGQRMMVVLMKYAQENGYSVILDVSQQDTPVLWADNSIDITNEIVALYDKNAPSATAAPKPAAAPSKPAPAASKPAAPAKKQP